ncbi:hypothetical protein GY45DRAFT_563540 [Cubamyces sp. BRFM 1775]|nr:hypothetical protein GY45DRAFT_563540 [Cubamyces sp. BRFM 1775]
MCTCKCLQVTSIHEEPEAGARGWNRCTLTRTLSAPISFRRHAPRKEVRFKTPLIAEETFLQARTYALKDAAFLAHTSTFLTSLAMDDPLHACDSACRQGYRSSCKDCLCSRVLAPLSSPSTARHPHRNRQVRAATENHQAILVRSSYPR